jgi:hypothetical protein
VDLPLNASVTGTLAKAGVDGFTRTALWLLVGGLLVLAAYRQAHRARVNGDPAAAAVLLGCAAIVATPIAWPHHQIWLPLAGIVLAARTQWLPRVLGLVVLGFAYLHIRITVWSDAHGTGWFFDNLDFAMFAAICIFGLAARPVVEEQSPTAESEPQRV